MYNKELERQIQKLFIDLDKKINKIIINSPTNKVAANIIMRLVSSSISEETERYMIDTYSCVINKIKEESLKKPDNLNVVYLFDLQEEINKVHQFNIENIDAYKTGIEYKEVNRFYLAIITATSAMVSGIILKLAISNILYCPFFLIIVSALGAGISPFLIVPRRSKSECKKYQKAVDKFLSNLENDIINWFGEVELYFEEKIRNHYKRII